MGWPSNPACNPAVQQYSTRPQLQMDTRPRKTLSKLLLRRTCPNSASLCRSLCLSLINAPRPPPTLEIKLSTGSEGEFMLTGDTYQANGTATAGGGILRFKEYGIIFKSPFWFSRKWVHNGDPAYDETVLLAALNGSVQIKLSTTDGSYTKGTDGISNKN